MLSGKKILLGVTGSIAAYKAAFLMRLFVKAGAEVRVVMSPGAEKFVTPLTFSNLSRNAVFSDLWGGTWTEHVHLGNWADLYLIAPATANTLAKMAIGACDTAVQALYLSATCPVWVAPAMDADMFRNPGVQRSIAQLQEDGVRVLPSEEGDHASGLSGPGRLAEPEQIFQWVTEFFADGPLKGKNVLITAGPTAEPLDPVRFITNHSSGKMGFAIAEAARDAGAKVRLVAGPVHLPTPQGVERTDVKSAQDMFEATTRLATDSHIVIMAAAVADYTPVSVADEKIKKGGENLALELKRTKDILKTLGEKKTNDQFLVGFALETQDEEKNAKSKLVRKNLDLIVLNSLKDKGAGFGYDTNKIAILDKNGGIDRYPLASKKEVAKTIIQKIISSVDNE